MQPQNGAENGSRGRQYCSPRVEAVRLSAPGLAARRSACSSDLQWRAATATVGTPVEQVRDKTGAVGPAPTHQPAVGAVSSRAMSSSWASTSASVRDGVGRLGMPQTTNTRAIRRRKGFGLDGDIGRTYPLLSYRVLVGPKWPNVTSGQKLCDRRTCVAMVLFPEVAVDPLGERTVGVACPTCDCQLVGSGSNPQAPPLCDGARVA